MALNEIVNEVVIGLEIFEMFDKLETGVINSLSIK